MEKETDPRFLNLLLAAMAFIHEEATAKNQNPFVEGLGNEESRQEAYLYLTEAVQGCEEFYPQLSKFMEEIDSTNQG